MSHQPKLIRNAAACVYCGHVLESTHVHDFRTHHCEKPGKIGRRYDHERMEYVAAFPMFGVDGGLEYVRRIGDPEHRVEMNEWSNP